MMGISVDGNEGICSGSGSWCWAWSTAESWGFLVCWECVSPEHIPKRGARVYPRATWMNGAAVPGIQHPTSAHPAASKGHWISWKTTQEHRVCLQSSFLPFSPSSLWFSFISALVEGQDAPLRFSSTVEAAGVGTLGSSRGWQGSSPVLELL